jgi:ATP:ADP antiporter, AAA family
VNTTRRRAGVTVCALAFVMLFGYAIARPATESLFLGAHGTAALPEVWLAVAACAIVVVTLYNRAAAGRPLGEVMLGVVAASAASLGVLLAAQRLGWSGASFALYVWKDVHIVILLEGLWSFANLVFPSKTARWAYGLFCAAGSIGGMIGNLSVGWLAGRLGTGGALWLLLPVFMLEGALVVVLSRVIGNPSPQEDRQGVGLGDFELLRRSRYLGWMLLLIGLVQLVITLLDFVYNDAVAAAYPAMDERTAVIGRVYAAIDATSLALQLATGLVLRLAGLRATLIGIPALLGTIVVSFALSPRFSLMAVTKIASKAFDYSLFRAAKEMLYLPLGYAEKTRGKALVDMLTYRVAKGGASLLLVALVALELTNWVLPVTTALIVAWLAVTLVVTRRHAAATQ